MPSETLTANIHVSLAALMMNVVSDGTAQFQMDETGFLSSGLTSGSGADQGDQLYDEVTTLASGNALDLSVHDFGGFSDQLGQIRAVTTVRMLAIKSLGNRFCKFVSGVAINNPGSGYLINDLLSVSSGTGTAVQFIVTAVGGGGTITGIALNTSSGYTGGSYSVAPSTSGVSLTGGTGTLATANLIIGTYDYILGNVLFKTPVFTDSDALTFGGDGTTGAWTSLFGTNTDKYIIPSGTQNLPGTLFICGGGATAWVVGASSTNKNVKITNTGSNPVTFRLIVIGS